MKNSSFTRYILLFLSYKSRVKVQQKRNHEKKQQWKKAHVEREGKQTVKETRGSERKWKRWTVGRDDERTRSEGVIKEKEGVRE